MGMVLKRMFPAMALATLVSSLLAVTMGGVVRVTGSGLGCPDWPLCYGQVIPPWVLESWLEYIHRLSAAVAGLFTVLMVASAFARFGTRGVTMHLVVVSAVLIVVQAGFGAYTVLSEISPLVALIHTAIATSLVGVLAVVVARTMSPVRPQTIDMELDGTWDGLRRLIVLLAAAAFIVILSGAYVTRTEGASLACTSIPFCGTSLAGNAPVQWVHMAHRVAAFTVGVVMLVAFVRARRLGHIGVKQATSLAAALLTVQIALGMGNVLLQLPNEIRAAHLVAAILFFAVTMLFIGRLWNGESELEEPYYVAGRAKLGVAP